MNQTHQAPNQGQRIILDQNAPKTVQTQNSHGLSATTYYWIGAVVLIAVAVLAIISIFGRNTNVKNKK